MLSTTEKVRTSSTLIMKYTKNEDKYNKFRKLIRNHFSHKACTNTDRDGLLAFELWGGLKSDEMIKRINELKNHGIEFEDIFRSMVVHQKPKAIHIPSEVHILQVGVAHFTTPFSRLWTKTTLNGLRKPLMNTEE